jgi:hypothetical protein
MTAIEWVIVIIGAFAFFSAGICAGAGKIMNDAIKNKHAWMKNGKFTWYKE